MSDYRGTLMGLGISMPLLAIIAVAMRCQARLASGLRFEADDYFIFVALFFAISTSVDVIVGTKLGNIGGHEKFSSNGLPVIGERYFAFKKIIYAGELLLYPCLGATKISILLLYRRIFIGRNFRLLVLGMNIWTFAWLVAFELAHLFGCVPISAIFAIKPENPKCVDSRAMFTSGSVTSIITDVAILAIPSYNVWKLQMTTARKLALIGVFLLGALIVVAGILRLVYLIRSFDDLTDANPDTTYLFGQIAVWTMTEANLGVVAACLPTLRSINIILNGFRRLRASYQGTHSAGGKSGPETRLDKENRPRLIHRSVDEEYRTSQSSTDAIYMEPIRRADDIVVKKDILEHYEDV